MTSLVFIINVGAVLLAAAGAHGDMMRVGPGPGPRNCWPSNTTRGRCFASLPPRASPWPSVARDSYTSDSHQGFDLADYTVTSVERDPSHFCEYQDKMVAALSCMQAAIKANCSDMADEMFSHTHRVRHAFHRYCNRTDKVDATCMRQHLQAVWDCKTQMRDSRQQNEHRGSMSMTGRSTPEPAAVGEMEPESTSEPEPEREERRKGLGERNRMVCYFKYKMMRCVKKSMEPCHRPTAQIVGDLMMDVSSANCSVQMGEWAALESSVGGATSLSVALAALLLPGLLITLHLVASSE